MTNAQKLVLFEKYQSDVENLTAENERLGVQNRDLVQGRLDAASKLHHHVKSDGGRTEVAMIHVAQIRNMKKTLKKQYDMQSRQSIRRPTITKLDRKDYRLTSTQELLGLRILSTERDEKGNLLPRGRLKDQCWR